MPSPEPSGPRPPDSPESWATHLKTNWQRRAESPYRDYFVAPQGIDDRDHWNEEGQRLADAVLVGLNETWLADQHLLEIGCGVGRLARAFAPRVASYTGIDIAPAMLEEARTRESTGRFFESDGLRVPDPARDRRYGLIMVIAVFVHCPRDVIESNIRDAYGLLEPGGVMRVQVLADPNDDEGVIVAQVAEQGLENFERHQAEITEEQVALVDQFYMGHAFGYAELGEFLTELGCPDARLYREELTCIYASLHKPE